MCRFPLSSFLFLFILLFSGGYSSAQTINSETLDFVPPSPEASSHFKFSQVPVSHYTGLSNISVPIYSINSAGTSIPISLNYHSRGISVSEMASRVGLGWALNFGGVITRQVRGKADDSPHGFLRKNFYETFFTSSSTRQTVYNDDINGEVDLFPDKFVLSTFSHNADFIFDQSTKEVIQNKFSDMRISPIYEGNLHFTRIVGWELTTENGYIYYFGTRNGIQAIDLEQIQDNFVNKTSGNYLLPNEGGPTYNSWYLLEVLSPQGESITFHYEQENLQYYRRSFDKFEPSYADGSQNQDFLTYFSKINMVQNQIKEINFKGGKVVFNEGAMRHDLQGGKVLDYILLYNEQNELINKWIFNYHYTTDFANTNMLGHFKIVDSSASNRLFLSSLIEVGKNHTKELKTTFEYNSNKLPNRFSNAIDYWGYYNGKNNGSKLSLFSYNNVTVDRSVNTGLSQAGMLEKINYPTGGSVKFNYEHNTALPPFFRSDVYLPETNPIVWKHEAMIKGPTYWNGSYNYDKTIVIDENLKGSVRAVVQIVNDSGCSSTMNMSHCRYSFLVIGPNTSMSIYSGSSNLNLEPGTYTLRAISNQAGEDPDDYEDGFVASLSWDSEVINSNTLMYGPGKRIESIEYLNNGNLANKKSYRYETNSGSTSGKIISLPEYYAIQGYHLGQYPILDRYGATSGSPFTAAQGNGIGYTAVQEFDLGDSSNGMIDYRFSYVDDQGDFFRFPYTLPTDNEWLRGKPLTTEIFKKSALNMQLKKKVTNEYLIGGIQNGFLSMAAVNSQLPYSKQSTDSTYWRPFIVFTLDQDNPVNSDHDDYKIFHLNSGTLDLFSQTTTTYEDAGNLIESVIFTYDYPSSYQKRSEKVTQSNGDNSIRKFFYPQDKNLLIGLSTDEYNALAGMVAQNRRDELIQIENYVVSPNNSSFLISKSRKDFYGSGNNFHLKRVMSSKSDANLQENFRFLRYNFFGKPLEVEAKIGGLKTVYIWGYNSQYPIAKIENASYAQVAGAMNNGQGISVAALDHYNETHLSSINSLRNDLPKAMITTYTYKPLVGISSITDPKGYTILYEYDDFNRLKFTKNSTGQIISENKYNYKNSSTP